MTDILAEVTRTARELYYDRGQAGGLRDLETHEALFISAVNSIQSVYARTRGDGLRTWGRGAAYDALCNLANREEAHKLREALAAYKAEKARRDNFPADDDEVTERVALAMAAE